MLYYKTVDENTLGLLRKLQSVDSFSGLRLVGGTSLALQIGHRKSIDGNRFLVTKSLTCFEDADRDHMPVMLQNVEWKTIKSFINTSVNHFMNNQF